MKRVYVFCFTFLSALAFSETSSKAVEHISLDEAKMLGLQVNLEEHDKTIFDKKINFLIYKINFNKFNVCQPSSVKVRNYSDSHEMLLDVKLVRVGKWYEFSVGKGAEFRTSIVVWCKSGDRNVYHISM